MALLPRLHPRTLAVEPPAVSHSDFLPVVNPATQAVLAWVPRTRVEQAVEAVRAAAVAQPAWGARTATDRAAILRRWHALMQSHHGTARGPPIAGC
jgi:acyl-CoA reductase-like NAD-dependent aldehyde dehydrogenase